MGMGGRAGTRARFLRRAGIIGAILLLFAILLLLGGHLILGMIFAVAAAAAIWVFSQARRVR
jgi:hypothetical protein